jgi:HK97 gp10 family phage protein
MAKVITKGGVTSASGRCIAQLRSLQNIGEILPMPMAQYVAKRAREYAHVITGYMKAHTVAHKVSDTKAELISSAPYAGYEEFGTRFRPPHPFIRPAIVDARVELPNLTRKDVNREIRKRVNSA